MIIPTNGRIVWYTPSKHDAIIGNDGQPLAAIVAHVWNDRMVTLCVFDPMGFPYPKPSVQLVQEGDVVPSDGGYCEWMPYQKGQAAKTEEAQAKLGLT